MALSRVSCTHVGGIGNEIVDSEAQRFHASDTRHEMIGKYDLLNQFVWLNGDKGA